MFRSVDPQYGEYPGWSPYAYVLDNPMKYTDPNGKAERDAQKRRFDSEQKSLARETDNYSAYVELSQNHLKPAMRTVGGALSTVGDKMGMYSDVAGMGAAGAALMPEGFVTKSLVVVLTGLSITSGLAEYGAKSSALALDPDAQSGVELGIDIALDGITEVAAHVLKTGAATEGTKDGIDLFKTIFQWCGGTLNSAINDQIQKNENQEEQQPNEQP